MSTPTLYKQLMSLKEKALELENKLDNYRDLTVEEYLRYLNRLQNVRAQLSIFDKNSNYIK